MWLGVWYSDDKKTAFKVLERDEKSTSIKLTFGTGGIRYRMSDHESRTGVPEKYAEISGEK